MFEKILRSDQVNTSNNISINPDEPHVISGPQFYSEAKPARENSNLFSAAPTIKSNYSNTNLVNRTSKKDKYYSSQLSQPTEGTGLSSTINVSNITTNI